MNSTRITIIGSETCGPCITTKRAFASKHIGYTFVEVDTLDPERTQELRSIGTALPIVLVDGGEEAWSGFRPDRIDALHLDLGQTYESGEFRTHCSCGEMFPGLDPDEADSAHAAHREQDRPR